ncbi:hypothetical protein Dimus_011735 [Dionaea muscipula]
MANQSSKSLFGDGWECYQGLPRKEFKLPNISRTWLGVEFVLKKDVLDGIMEQISYPAAIFDDLDVPEILSKPSFPLKEYLSTSSMMRKENGCLSSISDFPGKQCSLVSLRDKHPHILTSFMNPAGFFVPNPLKKPRRKVGPRASARGPKLGGQFSTEKSLFDFGAKLCCNLCKMPSDTNEALVWHMTNGMRPVVKEEPVDFGLEDISRAKRSRVQPQ